MTDETSTPSTAAQDLEQLSPPLDEVAAPGGSGFSRRAKAAGVFATALVVGAVGVFTLQSSSASPSANQGPGGGPPGMQGLRGPGGVQGTVTAVSASSITVGGTAYAVSSSTEVIVRGAPGSLSDIKKGDSVFVHAHGRAAERIFVGAPPQQGGPGFGPPPGQQTGSTSST